MDDLYSRSVTQYCERVGDYFYSEPINALSNIAFFVSALLLYQWAKKRSLITLQYRILCIFILLIGVGSTLWHSFINPYTHALDTIPIWIFFLTYLTILLRKLTKSQAQATTIALLVLFFVVQVFVSYRFPNIFNGSIRHIINGVALTGLLFWLHRMHPHAFRYAFIAFALYIPAIIFRSVDMAVCPHLPIGTHFLWHILNAITAFFAVSTLIVIDASKRGRR